MLLSCEKGTVITLSAQLGWFTLAPESLAWWTHVLIVAEKHKPCEEIFGDFRPHNHNFKRSFMRRKVLFQEQSMISEQFLSIQFLNRKLVQGTSYHWQTSSVCRENITYSFPEIGPCSTCLHWLHMLPAAAFWLHTLYPQALLQERVTQNMLFHWSLLLTRSLSSLLYLSYQT